MDGRISVGHFLLKKFISSCQMTFFDIHPTFALLIKAWDFPFRGNYRHVRDTRFMKGNEINSIRKFKRDIFQHVKIFNKSDELSLRINIQRQKVDGHWVPKIHILFEKFREFLMGVRCDLNNLTKGQTHTLFNKKRPKPARSAWVGRPSMVKYSQMLITRPDQTSQI